MQVQFQQLLQMVGVLGIGGTLLIGFQFSVITYPSQGIRRFINETWVARQGTPLPQETLTLLWSLVVSLYCLGGLVGCLGSSPLARRIGKKKTLMFNDVTIVAAALLLGFSRMANSFEMVMMGRFIYGFSAGICLNIQGPFLSEVSPEKFRGFAAASTSVFLSLGKALGQIMGLRDLLGAEAFWPLLLALCGFPALLQLLLLPLLPDSPPRPLVQKDHGDRRLRAVKSLSGEGPRRAETEEATEKVARKTSADLSMLEVVKDQSLWWPLTIATLLILSLQFSGLSAIYFYAFEVFRTARLEEDLIPYVALGVGICEFASTVLCSFMVDSFGRKILLWGGYSLMTLTMMFLIVTLSLQHDYPWLSYGSIGLIFLITIFYGLGPAGAAIAIMMELFSHPARSSAIAVAGSISWVGLFVVGITFPFVVEALSHFCFLIFLVLLAGMVVFIYNFVPETKGRSVMEIRDELNRLRSGKKLVLMPKENNSFVPHSVCTKL